MHRNRPDIRFRQPHQSALLDWTPVGHRAMRALDVGADVAAAAAPINSHTAQTFP